MVRSGHALSPEGGPPPCMARQSRCAGANLATKSLRHRRLSAQTPSGRPPGKISRSREEKAGGGKGGGGEEAGKREGQKESLFSLSGELSAPKKETKEGRRGGGFGKEEEEKG